MTPRILLVTTLSTALLASPALAAPPQPRADASPWTYKARRLSRVDLDALLRNPASILIVDVRRPDEVSAVGGFPVYLSVQLSSLEASLPFIPRDRTLVTVSNRAHRAGAAADLLASKGFTVAGAVGTKDYEEQGGTVLHLPIPPPKAPATPPAAP